MKHKAQIKEMILLEVWGEGFNYETSVFTLFEKKKEAFLQGIAHKNNKRNYHYSVTRVPVPKKGFRSQPLHGIENEIAVKEKQNE